MSTTMTHQTRQQRRAADRRARKRAARWAALLASAPPVASVPPSSPEPETREPLDPLDGFAVGQRVMHPTFGPGTVMASRRRAHETEVTVAFGHLDTKRIIARYARMTALGERSPAPPSPTPEPPPSSPCTCGSAVPNPTPEQMADVRAYLHIEYGIRTEAELHEVISARNRLVDVHNALVSIAGRGVDLLDDIIRDQTGEALVMLDQMINVDPAEADGYADFGDPEKVRAAQAADEAAESDRWYAEQDREMEADHAYAAYAAGRD